jgi:predicted nucleic acid-binding protein
VLVVADAGPLVYLSVVGELDLLPKLYDHILVPRFVFEEVVEKGAGLPGSEELKAADWPDVREVASDESVFRTLRATLDIGEAAAISLACSEGADLVLVDDRRGRQAARRLQLGVRGTLGVLLQAKREGAINEIATRIQRLIAAGFWVSDEVVRRVLVAAGESP